MDVLRNWVSNVFHMLRHVNTAIADDERDAKRFSLVCSNADTKRDDRKLKIYYRGCATGVGAAEALGAELDVPLLFVHRY